MPIPKIAHLTSVHPRYDTRIFVKECRSLSIAGYNVSLVVADGKGNETKDGVRFYDVGVVRGRVKRILGTTNRVFEKAIELDADIYHLHDPELMPIGLKLKKLGKKVIFDAHEDLPNQILSKHYLNSFIKKILSVSARFYESYACARFDGVVTATPYIRDKFLKINNVVIDINNYPIISELSVNEASSKSVDEVCYIGGLADVRGIVEMVEAMSLTHPQIRLNIAGNFSDKNLEGAVKNMAGWSKVNFLGFLNRQGVRDVLHRSSIGLVLLHPTLSYLDSLPVKMFEYMCSGLPVIASNFPLWKDIVEESGCGVCVDPFDVQAIAKAINWLNSEPEVAREMGLRGIDAVNRIYNWSIEEQKLLQFYAALNATQVDVM